MDANPSSGAGLRIRELLLRNWRNFRTVDLALQERVFLIGPNASGKSNFLDALRFLNDLVSVGGGLQDAVLRRGGVPAIRCLAARQNPEVSIRVVIGSDQEPTKWIYELAFIQETRRSGRPSVLREHVYRDGRQLLTRPGDEDRADPARLTQTHLEQVNVNREFREIAEFLTSIRYLHIVPQLVRDPDRSKGRQNDPFGGDFLEQIAKKPTKTRTSWLRQITKALRVAVPQLEALELWRDVRGTPHLRGKYVHWRKEGAWQNEDSFSDGTLRLMGLLWAVLDSDGPLLLEEPELSLHPGVVRYLPQMFATAQRRSGRQIILSTHSSDLLQDRGIGIDEVLMLVPGDEGTTVRLANSFREIPELLRGGLSLADAVIPRTRPEHAEQLVLFGAKGTR
jgi:hypothetical protein